MPDNDSSKPPVEPFADFNELPDGSPPEEDIEQPPGVSAEPVEEVSNYEEDTHPNAFKDGDYDGETPASDAEMKSQRGTSNADMDEDFGRFSKAADEGEKAIHKKAFDLEQKLHSVDFAQKTCVNIWMNPIFTDILDAMSEQLNVPKSEVAQAALLLFYRTFFSDERRMLNDLGFMLDNLSLQLEEMGMEMSAFEDLANMAVELELSPFKGTLSELGKEE